MSKAFKHNVIAVVYDFDGTLTYPHFFFKKIPLLSELIEQTDVVLLALILLLRWGFCESLPNRLYRRSRAPLFTLGLIRLNSCLQ